MEKNLSSLATLESYINELFSGNANKEQIQKIHHVLDDFSRQKGAWKDALFFLSQTTNPQTAMYSLTVLENSITKCWSSLLNEEQNEIRRTLYHWLLEKHQFLPYFIRNKTVHLIVHIARLDWPEKYPDFFNNIFVQISSLNASSTILGLLFLQATSEELGTPRDDLLSTRKVELKQNLLHLVPQILTVLTGLLQSIWEKRAHPITSTPPPSPTNPLPSNSTRPHQDLSASDNSSYSLNSEAEQIARLSLQCLTHLFSWIPLSCHVTSQLVEFIFHFVALGTEPTLYAMNSGNEPSVPVAALGAVNEILYKNCVPAEFESFFVILFNNCCVILHRLINRLNDERLPQPSQPQFIEKLVELVHVLVSNHLHRLEGRSLPDFSVPQFLSLFFSFTFEQVDWACYASCLDTWKVFLTFLKQSCNNGKLTSTFDGESLIMRYQDSLVALSEQVLKKMLFMNNSTQLEELDDEINDGSAENEREKLIQLSIDIFIMAAELVKNRTFSLLNEPFQQCSSTYQSLATLCSTNNYTVHVEPKTQLKEIFFLLKDLATILQYVGRLSELCCGLDSYVHVELGKTMIEKLVDLATCGSIASNMVILKTDQQDTSLKLLSVHSHILLSLQAWCRWISTLPHTETSKEEVNLLVCKILAPITHLFTEEWSRSRRREANEVEYEKLYRAAIQLLSAIITAIRSPDVWKYLPWNEFFYRSVCCNDHLPPAIQRDLTRCVISSAVVTWRNCTVEEQHWDDRQEKLNLVVGHVTQSTRIVVEGLKKDVTSVHLVNVRKSVLFTVNLLTDMAGLVCEESTASKVVVHSVIGPWFLPSLILVPCYVRDSEVTETLFLLYLTIFDNLLSQVGVTDAEKAIQTFLETFNQQNIHLTLQQENVNGIRAIERLLCILQIIVQEPGNTFKRFLPSTLSLCLDYIYPCLIQVSSPELKETFYRLLTLILSHHWRWFFKGSVLTTYASREMDRVEQIDNQSQFIAIMASYGQSFLQPEIALLKQNLEALDSLQSKWKLYHKAIFRNGIASQFISTLLDVLKNGSHELLKEEISSTIYSMASPDFEVFFQQFLPNYLLNCQEIQDHQRLALKNGFSTDTDLPSFVQNVYRFTNDLRCFRLNNISNASLYQC